MLFKTYHLKKPAIIICSVKMEPLFFVTRKTARKMWKRFEYNIVAELNKINAYINLEILIVLPERTGCCWRWLKLFLIVKGTANARNLKSNLQFHSLQLNGELESYICKKKKKLYCC